MASLEITSSIKIEENELQYDFIRASGPGGQNVNKVASSVQLRFDVRNSSSLNPDVKERLVKLAGSRITEDGILIIEAKRYRTQEQNRLDATQRLITLIQKAVEEPKIRRATRPSLSSKAVRVDDKRKRGEVKRTRGHNPVNWD
jgi:ribosome-associated protein